MNQPDYNDMRLRMLSEIESTCRTCGDRYIDASGKPNCRRPDCHGHSVREKALSITTEQLTTQN